MPPKRKKQAKKQSQKCERLNWSSFHLLENLLICCTVPDGNAPPESGVAFRINSPSSDNCICILFKIDREDDPLVTDEESRPDYMTFYADESVCVCTIIEMKGITEKGLEHGIKQIKTWYDKLRREIKNRLPGKFSSRLRFQGILLSPPNSQIPNKKILEEKERGFLILPLQWTAKAELFKYVSVVHQDFVKYIDDPAPHKEGHGFLESLLAEKASITRKQDSYYKENFIADNDERGIYINYEDNDSYITLCMDNDTKSEIAIKKNKGDYTDRIAEHLRHIGVTNRGLKIVKFD